MAQEREPKPMELKIEKSVVVEWRIKPVDGLSDEAMLYQKAEHIQPQFEELTKVFQESKVLGSRTQVPPTVAMRVAKVILENYKVERR